jgi:hypothetical protein
VDPSSCPPSRPCHRAMNALMSGSWLEGPLALLFLVAAMGANIMPSPRQQSGAVRGLPGDVHASRHALTRHWGRPKGLGRASVHPCCCRAISSILTLIRHPETSRPGVSCVIARTLSSVGEFSGLSKIGNRTFRSNRRKLMANFCRTVPPPPGQVEVAALSGSPIGYLMRRDHPL